MWLWNRFLVEQVDKNLDRSFVLILYFYCLKILSKRTSNSFYSDGPANYLYGNPWFSIPVSRQIWFFLKRHF